MTPAGEGVPHAHRPGTVAAAYAQARRTRRRSRGLPTPMRRTRSPPPRIGKANAQKSRAQAAQNAAALRDAVDRANRAIAQRNSQIVAALSQTTGLKLGDQPMDWWAWWWQDYNEMYNVGGATGQTVTAGVKPEYRYENRLEYAGSGPRVWPVTAVGTGPIPSAHSVSPRHEGLDAYRPTGDRKDQAAATACWPRTSRPAKWPTSRCWQGRSAGWNRK